MHEFDITTHVVLVLAAIEKEGKYLLAKRSSKDPQAGGQWSFPGGKVDMEVGDRVIEQTLKKEILEEVGVEIEDTCQLVTNDAFIRVSGHHVISLLLLCKYKSGEAKPLEDQEEVKWMSLEEILSSPEMPSYTRKRAQAIRDYLEM